MRTSSTIEFASVDEIEAFNNSLLREHVKYCYEHSAFYRRRFDEAGVDPARIRTKDDLRLAPLTTKADLEEFGRDFLCVPEREIVDLCQTSGTTGKPVIMALTESDLRRVGYNEKICFAAAGFTPDDKVMIVCALGRCFMAGLAYFEGTRQLGATAVRAGSGNPSVISQFILLHRPSVIICVPSQALLAADAIRQAGHDPAGLGVRMLMCIGEPVRAEDLGFSELGRRLKEAWNCDVFGTYASTEMATSFADCSHGRGGHFHPELITVEVLDDDGNPVEPGRPGEIVATPLQVGGMPLLRYCTGDVAAYFTEPCACGRKTDRLGPVIGRKKQMLKIRGTTVYPNAIFSVLQGMPQVKNYFLEVHGDFELSESIRVVVGIEDVNALSPQTVAEKIRGHIRVKPEVAVQPAAEVAARVNSEGKRKPVLFFDYRKRQISDVRGA